MSYLHNFLLDFWDIVKEDLIAAVIQFFATSWILPGYNSNIIALIPKIHNVVSIDQYRPISMSNFKFKVISKIIADRLAQIMPSIIFKEQMGFIHGRNIKDYICIASEAVNLLHNKAFGGNLALKIDITKAFDTLEWPFLLQVLKKFGFNDTFCTWIDVILKSAFLSISINGESHGYFNCTRGVRQGDPLSPFLFCIAEDVLNRSLSKLVETGKLKLIKGTRNFNVPSHSFYADDLMIFYKGNITGLQYLQQLFSRYAFASGQVINNGKSTIYSNSISQVRLNQIVSLLHFNIGSLPFIYLGIPIFKGKPKICASTSLSGNYTSKASNNSIVDFSILKAFNCKIHHPKAPQIREVIWYPPHTNWLKWNIDGASNGNPGNSACGGILRDHNADFILCFAEPLGICSSYQAELCAFMRAVELSHQNQWQNVWIETDSSLVVQAYRSSNQVPWQLRNRWNNVKTLIQRFNCIVSHVFREGNQVADSLANHGLSLNGISVWNEAPFFISSSFFRDKEGRSNFRFSS